MAESRGGVRRAGLPVLGALALFGCATSYSPCPLDFEGPLPDDAFERCAAVLRSSYGALTEADAASFRLQTDWVQVEGEASERRASVFRDDARAHSLAVVVERRRLTIPVVGSPHWTTSRGDASAERELVELLHGAISVAPKTAAASQRP
ncbi:MAG: hypothetical protein H6835_00655 [Planctomycetes bacterium]|nr:hypothetical protein [Planctomycetota bacterium]